jgi:hypothetical protein
VLTCDTERKILDMIEEHSDFAAAIKHQQRAIAELREV